ncbi:DMT family transporter [Bosea sp. TWI1241]|uniref:DMT family transporter n=1 Tax=Bosea sp. TWI1241 TaxID=3148904 RepID=UPI003207B606
MATAVQNRRGIIAMLGAMALFSVNDTFMKLARETFPTGQAVALRTVFALIAGFAVIMILGDVRRLGMALRPLVLGRGLAEALSALCFIWALGQMPLGTITAILMASPLLLVVLAVVLRLEVVGWRRAAALAVGFAGVLIVARPSGDGLGLAALVALGSAALVAARELLTRQIGPSVPVTIVSFSTGIVVGIVSLGFGLFEEWVPTFRPQLLYLVMAAVLVTLGNFCIINAFRSTDIGVVSGYRYAVVVFAVTIGYIVWDERPDAAALAGIALIVGSGLYTLHRQRVRRDSNLKPEGEPPL